MICCWATCCVWQIHAPQILFLGVDHDGHHGTRRFCALCFLDEGEATGACLIRRVPVDHGYFPSYLRSIVQRSSLCISWAGFDTAASRDDDSGPEERRLEQNTLAIHIQVRRSSRADLHHCQQSRGSADPSRSRLPTVLLLLPPLPHRSRNSWLSDHLAPTRLLGHHCLLRHWPHRSGGATCASLPGHPGSQSDPPAIPSASRQCRIRYSRFDIILLLILSLPVE